MVAQISRSTSLGCGAGLREQTAHGFRAHMRGAKPLALEDVALLDAGALGDPGVGRVDHVRQVGIGEHVRRHVAVDGGDGGAAGTRSKAAFQFTAMA